MALQRLSSTLASLIKAECLLLRQLMLLHASWLFKICRGLKRISSQYLAQGLNIEKLSEKKLFFLQFY